MEKESVQVITEHYQKTFEITYEMWKERNRLFVYLVMITGIGLLLLLRVPELDSLLVNAIVKLLGITDKASIAQLYKNFPLDVLLTVFLVIIFYLMQRLYSTNLSVMRNYLYLGAVEGEIRQHLGLPSDSVSFTREGNFYWGKRTFMQKASKWFFILVILIILLSFAILKLINDVNLRNFIVTAVDIPVSIITMVYFVEYARSAQNLDIKEVPSSNSKENIKSKRKK
jgi:uncharacterized integral membrane protein